MPSQSTSVRLAPEDPMPRSEMPCVVGLATMLEERRERLKPGRSRGRSSRLARGLCCKPMASSVVTLAGVSAAIFSTTVMEVFSGSGFGGVAVCGSGVCALKRNGKQIRAKQTRIHPARLAESLGGGGEDDLETAVIERGFRSLG